MFSSTNKHSSNLKSGWTSSRWSTGQQPTAGAASARRAESHEGTLYDSSWELSHGCEVAELSDVPIEWKDLAG